MKSNNLYDTVIKNGYDIGSGVMPIVNENITMELNKYGEYVSVSKNNKPSDFNDKKLSLVSAMSDDSANEDMVAKDLYGSVAEIKHHKTIGYYLDLYAGHVVEGDFRKNGSSGGMATWILSQLLKNGDIDGVIHVKKAAAGSGVLFEYGISKTIEEVQSHSKSRYYPAELSSCLKSIKKTKGKFAVIGIPSIIMEVRLLAKQDDVIANSIVYTVGLICGHQKSTKYADFLSMQNDIAPKEILDIDFRKKVSGRPANVYINEIISKKKTATKTQDQLYGTNWGFGFFKTKFADYIDDALNETADIVVGDAWLPQYINDHRGNNVIIVRNKHISSIIKKAMGSKKLKFEKITTTDILRSQRGLIHHTVDETPYRLYLKDKSKQWRPTLRTEASGELRLTRKLVQRMRLFMRDTSREAFAHPLSADSLSYFKSKTKKTIRMYTLITRIDKASQKNPIWVLKKIREKYLRKTKFKL